ncbi:hypothetical protein CgunFtcFv8_010833 [Champsocephalus gunnari]|uniref:NEDD4-binding protein 2-like 2 n=1 Tax=Champsocephalus gunnari TaxID=52237 RepID=A0AAN8HUY3_CHAGU|nr:hypothetical protein CgunFtcFv8_010833 [Champsocephalus gunnari]
MQKQMAATEAVGRNSHPGHTGIKMSHIPEDQGHRLLLKINGVILKHRTDQQTQAFTDLHSIAHHLHLHSQIHKTHRHTWIKAGEVLERRTSLKLSPMFQHFPAQHLPTERKEKLRQFGEDDDSHQRFDSEHEPWASHCRPPDNRDTLPPPLVLILMRGLPGSGKSTLARQLLSTGPSGLILSTDDFFAHREGYNYEARLLGEAHDWNHNRTQDAMHDGRSPIIIDNTNAQAWEMKPYVKMALDRGYKVDFCEPDTSWKFDPFELEKRNTHGVAMEKIARMMDRFSFPVSVDIVMNSQEPPHVNRRPEQPHGMRTRDFH